MAQLVSPMSYVTLYMYVPGCLTDIFGMKKKVPTMGLKTSTRGRKVKGKCKLVQVGATHMVDTCTHPARASMLRCIVKDTRLNYYTYIHTYTSESS